MFGIKGGEGGISLVEEVARLCEQPNAFHRFYDPDGTIEEKFESICKKIYHANVVALTANVKKQLAKLPICTAKTQVYIRLVIAPSPKLNCILRDLATLFQFSNFKKISA